MFTVRHIQVVSYKNIQEFVENEKFIHRFRVLKDKCLEISICYEDPISKNIDVMGRIVFTNEDFRTLFISKTEPEDSFNYDDNLLNDYIIKNHQLIKPE